MNPPTPNPVPAPGIAGRLMSLDALRGFDMLWITGGSAVIVTLAKLTQAEWMKPLAAQMEHAAWEGFRFYDLIFPMFVFMSGASIPFAIPKSLAANGTAGTVRHILVRGLLLFLLGIFQSGGVGAGWDQVRIPGVLQRIAISGMTAALLFCGLRMRGLIITAFALIAGYWALLEFVPVPGFGAGDYARGHNLANYLDRYIPGRLYDYPQDPEGLLSHMTAIVSCLLGVFAGSWLKRAEPSGTRKSVLLALAGAVLLGLGWAWSFECPVIKKIWTPSFVLVAGGWSALLLAIFHWIVDVRGWRRWAQPFVWIGMNSITIYLAANLVRFPDVANRITGGGVKAALNGRMPALGDFVHAVTALMLAVLFCRFLFKRKIFLRL